jgi:hypothetical protein
MITGQIVLQGFRYAIADGELPKVIDGKPTHEKIPIKVLLIHDANSGLQFQLTFLPEEFESFAASLQGRKIVRPGMIMPFPRGNGLPT